MVYPPLIKSASKAMLLTRLNWDAHNPGHQAVYLQMKEEAVHAFDEQLKGKRDKLKPAYANASPPYAANQYTDAAFSATIMSIWRNASTNTRYWYDQGAVPGGDNWIICWMLYHACRYRDARNCKASPRNFHDDDDLDENPGEGICPVLEGPGPELRLLTMSGSSSASTNSYPARTSGYYDAARDGYRK